MSTPSFPPLPSKTEWRRWVPSRPVLIAWVVLLGILLATYWPTFDDVVKTWANTPDYGHGFFVPLFSCFLLWLRQDMVNPWPSRWSWWALALFAMWAAVRWAAVYFNYAIDLHSLFFFLGGLVLFLGGWQALRWAWPSIVFLVFMVPLPGAVAGTLSYPLQRGATVASVFVLQTAGIPAVELGAEGNVIQLSDPANCLEVAQACSGLRMLMLFFAICVGAAFVLRARLWEKIVIVVSAVPIALLSNVLRITLNGAITEKISAEWGHAVHNHAGWFMMPLALLLLWGEMALIDKLLQEPVSEGPLALGAPGGAGRRGPLGTLKPGDARPAGQSRWRVPE